MEFIAKALPSGMVELKRVYHGDAILLECGWYHAVYRMCPKDVIVGKLAYDRIILDTLPTVALVQREIGCKYFGQRCPEDYVKAAPKVFVEIMDMVESA